MTNSGPITEARSNISEILDNVVETGEEYVITRHGKPIAVLLSYDEYDSLVETVNILSDDVAMAALAEADADIAAGRVTGH
jgi:antitoxin YefM